MHICTCAEILVDPRLRRYFQPKKGGSLKCSEQALKLWKTDEGSCLAAVSTINVCHLIFPDRPRYAHTKKKNCGRC